MRKASVFFNATYCFFFKASDVDLFFHWGRETLVPNLYPGVLYNNKSDKYTGFIDDRNNYLVGISRFRQARVQKGMKKIQMKIKHKKKTGRQYRNATSTPCRYRDLKVLPVRLK